MPKALDSAHLPTDRPTLSAAAPYQFSWFDWFCLWYPPGWLILFNRHWQHYQFDPDGWNWLEYLLFLIPGGFYLALLIRWLRLGCRSPQATQQTINPAYQHAFRQEILQPILKHYFRAELLQSENIPEQTPLIVIMNHAGMCFPWDMVGLGVLLGQQRNWIVEPVAHPIFFDHPWLNWWLPVGWSQVLGGVRADRQSVAVAGQQLDRQRVLLCAPEGWRGLAKGWPLRYQLQTFDPSFVQLSNQQQIPILPVVCSGNEWLHPWTIDIKGLARRVGLPMFPLSIFIPIFLLFPSMGVWSCRARLRYRVQPCHMPQPSTDRQSHKAAYRTAQELRATMQAAIDAELFS